MGAGLVKAAYRAAGAVKAGHAPTRAFAFMAVTALDHDARPLYWGRDALALALGKGPTTAGYRAVEEALRALRKLKLVEVARPSAPERPARYALLDGRGSPLQPLTDAQGSHVGVIEERESDAHDSADQRPRTSRPTPKAHTWAEEEEEKEEEGRRALSATRHAPPLPDSQSKSQERRSLTFPSLPTRRTLETKSQPGPVPRRRRSLSRWRRLSRRSAVITPRAPTSRADLAASHMCGGKSRSAQSLRAFRVRRPLC